MAAIAPRDFDSMLTGIFPRTRSRTSERNGSGSPFLRRTVRSRAAVAEATATFSFAVRPVRASWTTTGAPSAERRTSNSTMSAPSPTATANDAGEFSSARSGAPLWATTTGDPPLPSKRNGFTP